MPKGTEGEQKSFPKIAHNFLGITAIGDRLILVVPTGTLANGNGNRIGKITEHTRRACYVGRYLEYP